MLNISGNLEIWDLVLMKTDINTFLSNIEHFLSDIRGSRYLHLKKVGQVNMNYFITKNGYFANLQRNYMIKELLLS